MTDDDDGGGGGGAWVWVERGPKVGDVAMGTTVGGEAVESAGKVGGAGRGDCCGDCCGDWV